MKPNPIEFLSPSPQSSPNCINSVLSSLSNENSHKEPITICSVSWRFIRVEICFLNVSLRIVRAGEEIARVGRTGYTYLPHLHFQVFVVTGINVWTDFDTLEVQDFDISTNRP